MFSARDDEAALGISAVEALRAKGWRRDKCVGAAADRAQGAVRSEGHAHENHDNLGVRPGEEVRRRVGEISHQAGDTHVRAILQGRLLGAPEWRLL